MMSTFPKWKDLTLESCTDSLASSIKAAQAGAHRIELCADLDLDGLTPAKSMVEDICGQIDIPVKVMVRSRPGNFNYTRREILEMKNIITDYSDLNISGFVVGALTGEGLPDLNALREWGHAAGDIYLCFHKAIDQVPDWKIALDMISEISNIKAVLTSGQNATARNGINVLEEMVNLYGDRFEIIAAGSIRFNDIPFFKENWSGRSLHGRRLLELKEN